MASNSSTLPRVTFQTPEKPGEESSHRKLGKLTIKYNRKDLQRWLDLEEWINAQLQELYQCRKSPELSSLPEILFASGTLILPDYLRAVPLRKMQECLDPAPEWYQSLAELLQASSFTLPALGSAMFVSDFQKLTQESQNNNMADSNTSKLREETDAAAPEPQIDLEDLLEVPNEEQKLKLQEILHECSSPTEDFITELLSRLKGLRRVTNPQKK